MIEKNKDYECLKFDCEEYDIYDETILSSILLRNKLAIAIAHFVFRNGPIEDMHSNPEKNITDKDMKILNKYMVSRLRAVLDMLYLNDYDEILSFASNAEIFGADWDMPINGECEDSFENFIRIGELFGAKEKLAKKLSEEEKDFY